MTKFPTLAERNAFYGNPTNPKDPTKHSLIWELANLTYVKPPFKMTYAGKPLSPKGIRIHKKCAASLSRVFDALWRHADFNQETIDLWGVSVFSGSFNYRLMRNGNTLSNHSWACAIDLDQSRNMMNAKKPHFAQYPQIKEIFAAEGWYQLPNDQMHFEAITH